MRAGTKNILKVKILSVSRQSAGNQNIKMLLIWVGTSEATRKKRIITLAFTFFLSNLYHLFKGRTKEGSEA